MGTTKTFKIGDRVKHTATFDQHGGFGTIISGPSSYGSYGVKWADGDVTQTCNAGENDFTARCLEPLTFKAGDRVRYIRLGASFGELATVRDTALREYGNILLTWDKFGEGAAYPSSLEPVTASQDNPQSRGFNYGQPFSKTHSLLFGAVTAIADGLREQAQVASKKAWEVDAILRDVRIATTGGQYSRAEDALRDWAKANDVTLGKTSSGDYDKLAALCFGYGGKPAPLKVGDEVRYTNKEDRAYTPHNFVGTISAILDEPGVYNYDVRFPYYTQGHSGEKNDDSVDHWYCKATELTRV